MRVLIVGGRGQLGRSLVETAPATVACRSVDLPEVDITDPDHTRDRVAAETPDVIINAAAFTAVDRAEDEPDVAAAVNAAGPQHLARAARAAGCRLIHISTDYVFDGTASTPYAPDAPCRPLGVYGRSKRQGEINVLEALENAVIIRTAWLYSRHGGNFVLTMLRLFNEQPDVRVVADQIGSPTWATTLARAVWAAAGRGPLKGIYHWTDAGVASWYDFAVAIQEEALARGMLDTRIPIHPVATADYPARARRPAYSVLDCTASRRDLALPPVHWRTALRHMLDEVGRTAQEG